MTITGQEYLDRESALDRALNLMNKTKVYEANVILHLHFDQDEEWDYRGEHSISIEAKVKEYDKVTQSDRFVVQCFTHDMTGESVDSCKEKHEDIFKKIKEVYSETKKKSFTHD